VRVTPFNVLHCCDFMDCVLGGELSPVAVSFFSCFFLALGCHVTGLVDPALCNE
jgi:hypothetical protein